MATRVESLRAVAVLAGALCLVSICEGGTNVGKSYRKHWGSTYAWADLSLYANFRHAEVFLGANRTPADNLILKAGGRARASLLKRTVELIGADARAMSLHTRGTVSGNLRLVGYTLTSRYYSFPTGTSGSLPMGSGSRTFFEASRFFWVGPVPLTVKAELGGGYEFILNYNLAITYAQLHGGPRVWTRGGGWVGVDLEFAGAGVGATLKVMDTRLVNAMVLSAWNGFHGYTSVMVRPLSVSFYVNAWLLEWDYYKKLAGWSARPYEFVLLDYH